VYFDLRSNHGFEKEEGMSKRLIGSILVCALAGWTSLYPQNPKNEEADQDVPKPQHEVTVTANRIETPLKETGSSVTVILREDLERTGKTMVFEALQSMAQLNLNQSGPIGGGTQVQIRGSESQHVKILIDGVEVNDPINPSRTVNLAHLMVENINRIEIVSGPQSTLYGSDAMGGVIHIITREEKGPLQARFTTQAGSYGTLASSGELFGGDEALCYTLGFGQYRSDGFSAAGSQYEGNEEKDGYRNLSLYGKMGVSLRKNIDFKLSFRFTDAQSEIDNFGGDYGDDPNNEEDFQSLILNGEARGLFLNNRWESRIRAALSNNKRSYNNPVDDLHPFDSDDGLYKGGLIKMDWQNSLFLHESNTLTFGLEHTRERGESVYHSMGMWGPFNSDYPEQNAHNTGIYVQDQVRLGGIFFATVGGRWDTHSEAGSSFTYRAAPSFWLSSTGTRLKASLGTGFKAPSLYQLYAPATIYGPAGNTELEPEESMGWDAGIEQFFFENRLVLEAIYFNNRFTNLIDFDFSIGYINMAEATTRGFELRVHARPVDNLTINAAYVNTHAKNEITGEKLLRRPKHKFTAHLAWRPTSRIDMTIELIHVGDREDNFFVGYTSERVRVDAYTLLNTAASYRMLDYLQLFVRIDNMLNQEYEVIKGYGTPGFSAYAGFKIRL
jgi:vitamin B12 transporter